MAPIDYSRFDNIDTSSDTDDDDAEDANIEELLAEVEGGFSPEAVLDMASIIDSAVARTFGGDVDIMTDVLPPLHIRAGDSMFDGIAARIREYEDARPQRRRVALVANDVNEDTSSVLLVVTSGCEVHVPRDVLSGSDPCLR